jgi:hypothetical protein
MGLREDSREESGERDVGVAAREDQSLRGRLSHGASIPGGHQYGRQEKKRGDETQDTLRAPAFGTAAEQRHGHSPLNGSELAKA